MTYPYFTLCVCEHSSCLVGAAKTFFITTAWPMRCSSVRSTQRNWCAQSSCPVSAKRWTSTLSATNTLVRLGFVVGVTVGLYLIRHHEVMCKSLRKLQQMAALTLACLCAGLYANVARVKYEEKFMRLSGSVLTCCLVFIRVDTSCSYVCVVACSVAVSGVGTFAVDQQAKTLPVYCFDYEQRRQLQKKEVRKLLRSSSCSLPAS